MPLRTLAMKAALSLMITALLATACASAPPRPHPGIKNTPYTIRGVHYVPFSVDQARYYDEVGTASWYGPDGFMGGSETTANGERVTARCVSAAHKLLPLPSLVEVTNLQNGRRVNVRVNDRGPFVHDRILDVSSRAAELLGFKPNGLATVRVKTLRVGD